MSNIDPALDGAPDFEALLSQEFRQRFNLDENDQPIDPNASVEEPEPVVEPADAVSIDAGPDDDLSPEEQAARVIGTTPVVEPVTEDPDAALPSVLRLTAPDGTEFDLDVPTAQKVMGIAAWAESLPQPVREQFAAIEYGQAVAIPKADFERFRAWQQQHADDELDDDLPPAAAQRIAALEARLQEFEVQPVAAHANQVADRATKQFEETAFSYAAEHGLSDAERQLMWQSALSSGVIPTIAEQGRQYSPTGQLLVDCDYSEVARKAFDFAVINNPSLRQRVLAAPAPSAPQADPTAIKKARAGSLSSAPSAAVTTPPRDPRELTFEETQRAMAAEIAAAMNGNG
jgi:hypothetical protein